MIIFYVREIALSKGIRNAHTLAKLAGVPPNLAIRVWNDDFQRIDKTSLNKLCRALKCQPGKLISYLPDEGDAEESSAPGKRSDPTKKTSRK